MNEAQIRILQTLCHPPLSKVVWIINPVLPMCHYVIHPWARYPGQLAQSKTFHSNLFLQPFVARNNFASFQDLSCTFLPLQFWIIFCHYLYILPCKSPNPPPSPPLSPIYATIITLVNEYTWWLANRNKLFKIRINKLKSTKFLWGFFLAFLHALTSGEDINQIVVYHFTW